MDSGTVVTLVAMAMAVGVVGTVVPIVPGLALVWAAALAYGLAEGFVGPGSLLFTAITVVAVLGTVAGIVLPHRAAGGAGASGTSLFLGAAVAVAGFFLVPVVGLPLGGALGIYLGEHLRTRDAGTAWRATLATLKGFGLAAIAQFAAGLTMVMLWVGWVLVT